MNLKARTRLRVELSDLREKLKKLQDFLGDVDNANDMEVVDWNLLCTQRDIMVAYVGILETRMTNLGMTIKD